MHQVSAPGRRLGPLTTGLMWLACALLLAGCSSPLEASPKAVTAPSTYAVQVAAARTLAVRDLKAEGSNHFSTLYDDRKASACFRERWPSLRVYKQWWSSNWGPLSSGPGEVPSPTAPLKVLSARGDDEHQIVVIEDQDPTFMTTPVELYMLRRFDGGWAILNWLPYNPWNVTNGNPPYRVPDKAWNPCSAAKPYTPGDGP